MVVGDITDAKLIGQLVEGIDVVYHLASAHLDVRLSENDYRRVNVDATAHLLEAARAAGVKRVVHCSSVGVIGDVKTPPADETSPCHPTNIYERTKLAGERVALQFAQQTRFPVVVVRPAWVYGPRCPRTRKLFRAIGKGRFVVFGDGRTLRHPIYVADAVRGLERCAEAERAAGQVYILAGDKPITVAELARTIADVLGVRPPTISLPLSLGIVASTVMELAFKPLGKAPPFSRRSLDFFMKDNAYDISKARRELGFEPQVHLRSGMMATARWLNRRQLLPERAQVSATEAQR